MHFRASTISTLFASIFRSWADFAVFFVLFGTKLYSFLKIHADTAPSNIAIWDEFCEEH